MKPLIVLLAVLVAVPAEASCYYRHRVYVPYVKQVQVVLFQVGIETRAEAIAEKAAQKAIQQLQAQHQADIQSLTDKFRAALNGKVCVEFGGQVAGASGQPTPAVNDAPAQAVVNANCVSCHSGPGSKGGDKDFRDISKLDVLTRHRMELRARVGEMPPKPGTPVSDADAQVLQQWILGK